MKLASIDIGSNSVHMIVVRPNGAHSFEVLDRVKDMVFLGRAVFEEGRLTEEAFAVGLATLQRYAKLAQRHGVDDVLAVATSAVREAENGGEFLYALSESTGINAQVISGAEEGRFIYLAVRSGIDLSERTALAFDVGGGSVEAVAGDARKQQVGRSLKLGVQRLRARFGGGAPLGRRERRELEAHVREVAEPVVAEARQRGFDFVCGTSGTILALGQAAHQLGGGEPWATGITGQKVTLEAIRALTNALVELPPSARAGYAGLDAKRADTIHVGGVLVTTLLELAGAEELVLCDWALREGVVLDWLERASATLRAYDVASDIRRHSVLELVRRCGQTSDHPEHVARLSLRLFDDTVALHRLGIAERRLLEHAAWLHDIGQLIGYERHEHHAAYIIRNGELRGFSELEREIIALVARYHRKARPKKRDADYAALPPRERRVVRVLSAILRFADGLDRSHHLLVSDVACRVEEDVLVVTLVAVGDVELELWGGRRKSKLLSRVLDRKLRLEVERRRDASASVPPGPPAEASGAAFGDRAGSGLPN